MTPSEGKRNPCNTDRPVRRRHAPANLRWRSADGLMDQKWFDGPWRSERHGRWRSKWIETIGRMGLTAWCRNSKHRGYIVAFRKGADRDRDQHGGTANCTVARALATALATKTLRLILGFRTARHRMMVVSTAGIHGRLLIHGHHRRMVMASHLMIHARHVMARRLMVRRSSLHVLALAHADGRERIDWQADCQHQDENISQELHALSL